MKDLGPKKLEIHVVGLILMNVFFWYIVIRGILVQRSSISNYLYSSGKLGSIQQIEYDITGRFGNKTGKGHEVLLSLKNSSKEFFIPNHFSDQQNSFVRQIQACSELEIWWEKDAFELTRNKIFQIHGDGKIILSLETSKNTYDNGNHLILFIAICTTIITVFLFRRDWFLYIIGNEEKK